ncbi:WD repeat-containing on Y chromosome-like isoform X2 [Brachionus plicatilis]|uniref:WD repeat-containing on Y chromosome-like isoform X2 n=1 Tax=Brachionus plicatilis TaxID=10195 RepID=A0A3M7QDY8_BRAPC|nr:WD repeat-containing on Y chromosome-like isoform X2 [Brachionus plicatilis]
MFKSLEPALPKLLYGGIDQHEDEILCSDLYNNLLATGGSEGSIKIWSIDTKRLFLVLRDRKENSNDNQAVYKLLFLKQSANLNSTILISSENGYLSFWKLTFNKEDRLLTRFYACHKSDEIILSITTNSNESILITGDTKGFISLWDIGEKNFDSKIKCIKTWKCHDSAIVSIKYIQKLHYDLNSDILITASNDWCCRVWTMTGDYIGSFGQEKRWNLLDEKTFVSSEKILELRSENISNEVIKDDNEKLPHENTSLDNTGSKFDYLNSFRYFKNIKKIKKPYLPELITYEVDKEIDEKGSEINVRHLPTSFSKLRMHELNMCP